MKLPIGLRNHVNRARDVGRKLAGRHNVDLHLVDLSVAAHDLARALNGDMLLAEARRLGLTITPLEHDVPILLHGPVAAMWLEGDDNLYDDSILEAVRWHTTGVAGMSKIAKVVFLADKLDPQKVSSYSFLRKVESLAKTSVDEALLEYLDRVIESHLAKRLLVHPASLGLRNELVSALGP